MLISLQKVELLEKPFVKKNKFLKFIGDKLIIDP
jgi:hypothetical protein